MSSKLEGLLAEIAAKRRCFLPSQEVQFISDADREILIDALLNELSDTGLGPDDEPNERGAMIEDIIDFIGFIPPPEGEVAR